MYVTYQALDRVDYSTLRCVSDYDRLLKQGDPDAEDEMSDKRKASALQEICAMHIVSTDDLSNLSHMIEDTPVHLINLLLHAAIKYDKTFATILLISEWPVDTLCLADIYPEGKEVLFGPSFKFDNTLFLSLTRRGSVKEKCKLLNLDLREFTLNTEFKKMLISGLPFMSLPESERNTQQLTQHLLRHLSQQGCNSSLLVPGSPLVNEIIMILTDKLAELPNRIYVPDGQKLTIQIDRLDFTRDEKNEMFEFLTVGGLQSVLPYYVEANNLYIKTHVMDHERTIDSCGPFLALFGQKPEVLTGLSLNNMEDMVFQYILRGLERFTSLRALDIGDCSVSVSGNTRTRQVLRQRIVGLFSRFTHLVRLDLSYSDLQGHLMTLLDSLNIPLQYLSISGCAVEEYDLKYLGNCKHSASLKEIHLNALVRRGQIENPVTVLTCVGQLVETAAVIAIQSNNIEDAHLEQLCSIVSKSKSLKILDTLYNLLTEEALIHLTESICKCESMSVLTMNLEPVLAHDHNTVVEKRENVQRKVQEILHKNKRRDITVVVVAMGLEAAEDD